jgi:predicted ester cyclase
MTDTGTADGSADAEVSGSDGKPLPPNDVGPVNPYRSDLAMPTDFGISIGEKGGTDRLLVHPPSERRQRMHGFQPQYADIVDYIVRVTHRIWEEKEIGYIYKTYRHNSSVTDDSGLQYGRDKIVADTVHTINAFPDIRLYADEVIWAGDDRVGFHTSHRAVIIGHNTGFSRYGPPTGRKIVVWAIANCVAVENEIFREHVIYNNASLLQQLGFDLRVAAREFGNQAAQLRPPLDARFGEAERLVGQGTPLDLARPDEFTVEPFLRWAWHYTWNWRNLNTVDTTHAPTLRFHGPTGRELVGRGEYKSFILSIIAMFPDLALQVDDVYYMGNDADGYLASVRWSALGTHRGFGIYGPPTGRRVTMWGITQHRIRAGRVDEEWMLFNEFELMQQIYRDDPFDAPS